MFALGYGTFGTALRSKSHKMRLNNAIKYPLIEVHHFNSGYYNLGDPFIDEINATGFELTWTQEGQP